MSSASDLGDIRAQMRRRALDRRQRNRSEVEEIIVPLHTKYAINVRWTWSKKKVTVGASLHNWDNTEFKRWTDLHTPDNNVIEIILKHEGGHWWLSVFTRHCAIEAACLQILARSPTEQKAFKGSGARVLCHTLTEGERRNLWQWDDVLRVQPDTGRAARGGAHEQNQRRIDDQKNLVERIYEPLSFRTTDPTNWWATMETTMQNVVTKCYERQRRHEQEDEDKKEDETPGAGERLCITPRRRRWQRLQRVNPKASPQQPPQSDVEARRDGVYRQQPRRRRVLPFPPLYPAAPPVTVASLLEQKDPGPLLPSSTASPQGPQRPPDTPKWPGRGLPVPPEAASPKVDYGIGHSGFVGDDPEEDISTVDSSMYGDDITLSLPSPPSSRRSTVPEFSISSDRSVYYEPTTKEDLRETPEQNEARLLAKARDYVEMDINWWKR